MDEQIEKHELLEMRRVAAYIYKKAGRWKQSIALSKKDNHYRDAMETCSQSGDRELAEELLVYFIEQVFSIVLFYCRNVLDGPTFTNFLLFISFWNSLNLDSITNLHFHLI